MVNKIRLKKYGYVAILQTTIVRKHVEASKGNTSNLKSD